MVDEAPALNGPRLQGNPPPQGGVAETKVRPAGVGSPRVTPVASEGPALERTIEKVTFWPGVKLAGPVFTTERSAEGLPVTVAVELLFPLDGSAVELATVAVLEMVPGV